MEFIRSPKAYNILVYDENRGCLRCRLSKLFQIGLTCLPRYSQYLVYASPKTIIFTIVNIIESNIEKIRLLCSKHKVSRLFVFGSVLKDSFNKDSDIDLVVDFSKIELDDYADNYFDFKEQLESIFNRPVDLLEEKGIRNPFLKKQIDVEKQLIYGT